MHCPICNHETADDSNFCGNCGAKLSAYKKTAENILKKEQPAEPADTASTEQKPEPDNTPLNETPFTFNFDAQPSLNQQNGPSNAYSVPQTDFTAQFIQQKKSKISFFAIIAVVLAVAIGALYFSGAFSTGPLTAIAKATDKTLQAKSFDFSVQVKADNSTVKANGTFVFDSATQNIEAYLKLEILDETAELLLKDNILLLIEDGFDVESIDLSRYLDEFWEYSSEELDWSDLLESLGFEDLEDIDFDKFEKDIDDFLKNLNNKKYINKKLGTYEKTTEDGTTSHHFELKLRNISKELVSVFAESFMLEEDDQKNNEVYLYEVLKDTFGGSKVEVFFNVKSGYLIGFGLKSGLADIEAKFTDIGKAKIDENIFDKYESYFKVKNQKN